MISTYVNHFKDSMIRMLNKPKVISFLLTSSDGFSHGMAHFRSRLAYSKDENVVTNSADPLEQTGLGLHLLPQTFFK